MFSKTTKVMLRNVIQHTGTHNRIVEETEMWSQYKSSKERQDRSSRNSFLFDQRSDYYDDRRQRRQRTAHMDSSSDEDSRPQKSTYWARQLQKAEEADPDRWGHSGFKELYPEDFDSDREDRGSSKKKKKKKKERKHKKKKKQRKRRHDSSSDLESDSDTDDRSFRTKHSKVVKNNDDRRRKRHRESRESERHKQRKRRLSSSLSDSSESSHDHHHRKTERRKDRSEHRENGDKWEHESGISRKRKKHKQKSH